VDELVDFQQRTRPFAVIVVTIHIIIIVCYYCTSCMHWRRAQLRMYSFNKYNKSLLWTRVIRSRCSI